MAIETKNFIFIESIPIIAPYENVHPQMNCGIGFPGSI